MKPRGYRSWAAAAVGLALWPSAWAIVKVGNDLELEGYVNAQNIWRVPSLDDAEMIMQRNTAQVEGKYYFLREGEAFGRFDAGPIEEATFTFIGRGVYDSVYDFRDRYDDLSGGNFESTIREAFVDFVVPPFTLRLGKQQVVWGEADNFRALDVINPLDLSWHWSRESWEDIRIPLWMARGIYDGEPSLLLSVEMQKGKNIVELGESIRDVFSRLNSLLPPDVRIDLIANQPEVVKERITHVFHGDGVHVRTAHHAQAQQVFVGVGGGDVVAHRAFGQHQEVRGLALLHELDHRVGRTRKIGGRHHFRRTLRMSDHRHIRELLPHCADVFHCEFFVDFAAPMPANHFVLQVAIACLGLAGGEDDVFAGFSGDIARQVLVRQEYHLVGVEGAHDCRRVARGAADVALGLDVSVGVDISHHWYARETPLQSTHVGCRDARRQ